MQDTGRTPHDAPHDARPHELDKDDHLDKKERAFKIAEEAVPLRVRSKIRAGASVIVSCKEWQE